MLHSAKRFHNLLISVVVVITYSVAVYFLYYPDSGSLGPKFSTSVVYMLTERACLITGVILFLLRITRVIPRNSNLLYVLFGFANFILGVVAGVLYFANVATQAWLNQSLLNLLVGFVMLSDTFILFKEEEFRRDKI